jgi:hypothetical protein
MDHSKIFTFIRLMPIVLAVLLQACSIPTRTPSVPENLISKAQIPGMPNIRYTVGGDMSQFVVDAQQSFKSEMAYRAKTNQTGTPPPANFLAISGGGDNGAYGAGLLCGWTDAGNRPEFKLVTGISTGALIAPFAFLGSKYDAKLKHFYTNISAADILEERGVTAAVLDDGLTDNRPLWNLLEKSITAEMLHEIALEHAKGRILLVATTNLDSQQAIIWNMTKIAASGDPKGLDLFRKLMMASAAIPGAFPPTMIEVEADGKPYQEMHVDGGGSAQVFVYPPSLQLKKISEKSGVQRERNLYVIRNSGLNPKFEEVERRTLTIAGKAIESLIRTQGIGDLYRIYAITQRDGVNFNLAYIPESFKAPHKEEFDTEYMRALFKNGYDAAVKGYPWNKTPPGF